MIPVMCRVKHDPENGTHGDCVRACIATLMGIPNPDDVPHFYHDGGGGGPLGVQRLTEWLALGGYVPFWSTYDCAASRDDILELMNVYNPTVNYLLFGATNDGNHVVVCTGGRVVHDPSWYKTPLIGPASSGFWQIMVVAKL